MLIYLQMLESEDDRVRFEQIYMTYSGLMFCAAKRILKSDANAEDAVHEAFLSIAKNLEKISDIHCPKTRAYIVIIVERKALDIIRKRKHEVLSYDDAAAGIEITPPGDNGLADAMAKLNPRYRQVLLLRYDNGYTAKEIAKMFGMTPAAVEKLLWRAKTALQKQLSEDGAVK